MTNFKIVTQKSLCVKENRATTCWLRHICCETFRWDVPSKYVIVLPNVSGNPAETYLLRDIQVGWRATTQLLHVATTHLLHGATHYTNCNTTSELWREFKQWHIHRDFAPAPAIRARLLWGQSFVGSAPRAYWIVAPPGVVSWAVTE